MRTIRILALSIGPIVCIAAITMAQSPANIVVGGTDTLGFANRTANVTITSNTTVTNVVTSNNTTASADAEWQSVEKLFVPLTPVNAQSRITVEGQAAQFLQASRLAKSFQVRYPRDSRVVQARKLEALGAVQAAQLAGTQYATNAVALGTAYRNDHRNPVKDRVEMAVAMEAVAMRGKLSGKGLPEDPAHAADFADRLFAEFGDDPDVYHVVRGLMRAGDAPTGQALAAKINQRSSPPWVKDEANKLNQRVALPQRTIMPVLIAAGITPLQLGSTTNQPTVLFFWGKSDPEIDLAALRAARGTITGEAKWVYAGMGVSTKEAAINQAPFAGTFLGVPTAFRSALALELGVNRTPWVCVLDKMGNVAGSGRVRDLPVILAEATK